MESVDFVSSITALVKTELVPYRALAFSHWSCDTAPVTNRRSKMYFREEKPGYAASADNISGTMGVKTSKILGFTERCCAESL